MGTTLYVTNEPAANPLQMLNICSEIKSFSKYYHHNYFHGKKIIVLLNTLMKYKNELEWRFRKQEKI